MSLSVAIYARVSTDAQAEHGYSLKTQISACKEYAKSMNASTIQTYIDDGYSGAFLERPQLDALRDALQAKIYDTIICYTPDRLARRLSHQLLITEEIEKSGAALHFVNTEYKTTPEGQLFFQIQGSFAEYEREKIRERTMRGMRGKLKSGKPISDSHAFGYDFINGEYTINEQEAIIVQKIFDLYTEQQIGGTDLLAKRLNELHIPSPLKSQWRGSTVCRILKNSMYIGSYYAYKKAYRKTGAHSRTVIPRPQNEWIPLQCPAIISKETFSIAQHLLESNKKHRKRQTDRGEYLLSGMMKCSKCGSPIIVVNNKSGRYYACYAHTRRSVLNKDCDARYAKTEIVDSVFWETLQFICSSKKRLESYIKQIEKKPSAKKGKPSDIQERLAKIESEKAAVLEWFTNGYITQATASKKLADLTMEGKKLSNTYHQKATENPAKNVESISNLIKNCKQDTESKKRVVRSIIRYIEYERTDNAKKSPHYSLKFLIHFV